MPVLCVLDNAGYGTERFLHPGEQEFNNIQPWRYAKLPEVLGGGTGYEVRTEGEFDAALSKAWADTSAMSLIQVHIGRHDSSEALKRLAERLSGVRKTGDGTFMNWLEPRRIVWLLQLETLARDGVADRVAAPPT